MGFVLYDLSVYMYVLLIVVCPFVLFHLAIVLSVLLRYTDFDCSFGIFKLFFSQNAMEVLSYYVYFYLNSFFVD